MRIENREWTAIDDFLQSNFYFRLSIALPKFAIFQISGKFWWAGKDLYAPFGGAEAFLWRIQMLALPCNLILLHRKLNKLKKTVGREGFEPSKCKHNRFTVCPRWPLGYLP